MLVVGSSLMVWSAFRLAKAAHGGARAAGHSDRGPHARRRARRAQGGGARRRGPRTPGCAARAGPAPSLGLDFPLGLPASVTGGMAFHKEANWFMRLPLEQPLFVAGLPVVFFCSSICLVARLTCTFWWWPCYLHYCWRAQTCQRHRKWQ